jgi:hypothetical protein
VIGGAFVGWGFGLELFGEALAVTREQVAYVGDGTARRPAARHHP